MSYRFHKGEIPPNLHVHHACHNKKCVNPDHLEVRSAKSHRLHHATIHRQAAAEKARQLLGMTGSR